MFFNLFVLRSASDSLMQKRFSSISPCWGGAWGAGAGAQGCSVAVPALPEGCHPAFWAVMPWEGWGKHCKAWGTGDTALSPLPWSRWGADSGAVPSRGCPFAPAASWPDQSGAGGKGGEAIKLFSLRPMLALGDRGGGHGAGYWYPVLVGLCWVLGARGGRRAGFRASHWHWWALARLGLPGASRCFSP